MANQLSADLVVVGDIKTIAGGQLSRTAVLPVTYQNKAAPAVGPTIPAGATLTGISVIVTTQSNDSGTATLAAGWVGGTGTELVAAQDVKTAAGVFHWTDATPHPFLSIQGVMFNLSPDQLAQGACSFDELKEQYCASHPVREIPP